MTFPVVFWRFYPLGHIRFEVLVNGTVTIAVFVVSDSEVLTAFQRNLLAAS